MIRSIPRVAAVSAGLVVFAATLGGGIVLAQSNDNPAGAGSMHQAQTDTPPAGQDPKARIEEFIKKLAANVGVTEQQLKDGLKKTSTDELDKALADGKIDQATADKIRAAIQNGEGGFGFGLMPIGGRGKGPQGAPGAAPNGGPQAGPNGGGQRGGAGMGLGNTDAIAKFLGIDAKTLQDALGSGQTPAEVAKAHGKSRDELKAFLISEMDTHLKQQVDSGKLTQAQADAMRTQSAANIDKMLDSKLPQRPNGFGGPGGPGGAKPGMPGSQGGQPSTTN
jgi:hypothetical protein